MKLSPRIALAYLCAAFLFGEAPGLQAAEPWSTYRGNLQRTANTDGLLGPASPKVLWVLKSQEHFIATPVPHEDHLFMSGLGAFNVSTFYCLAADPKATQRILWTKSTPYLKLPVVSSPALAGDKIVFGDGMHQTDGARLHCLRKQGLPLWQLTVPGTLVHLEGSPTIANGKVYIGGGAAGVLCIDLDSVTLEGKKLDLAEIQKILDQKWQELQAKYEADKKKDPDFAVPPNDDQLPKPSPRRMWQQGEGKWHVDAPVAVAGNRVLVASAYLDKEKLGERELYCLDAETGAIRWQAPLKVNPWGGPSVSGDTVVLGGSTIGYDPKLIKGARGDLAAFNLSDGKEKWHKELPGGVLSCVALADGLAVATATDGKVRAFDLATGERRWIYEGKAPFFAAPALAGGVVYAGDLRGVVHAMSLANGKPLWTLDLALHPDVKAPGMIYAGPAIHGGRLFIATCNLEGPHAGQPTAMVCIGDK